MKVKYEVKSRIKVVFKKIYNQITKESIIENTYLLKISPLPSPKRLRAGRYPLFACL